MANYVDKTELKVLIERLRAGDMSAELVRVVGLIVEGIARKYWRLSHWHDRDDVLQMVLLNLWRFRDKIKADANPFSYLTEMAHNVAWRLHDQQVSRRRNLERLRGKAIYEARYERGIQRNKSPKGKGG